MVVTVADCGPALSAAPTRSGCSIRGMLYAMYVPPLLPPVLQPLLAPLLPPLLLLQLSPYPSRWGLGLSLLGIVLGPVTAWQAWQAIRNREGDYDPGAYSSSQTGAWVMLAAGVAATAGAAYWLVRWLPEYLFW